MLREFRAADVPAFVEIYQRNFPEEDRYLEIDRAAFSRIVERIYRPLPRLILGILRRVGRPVFRLFVVEVDGALAGTALVSFTPRAGHVGLLQVDAPFRRRGLAQLLLDRCVAATRAVHRPFVVLDVLHGNSPGRTLYDKLGFRFLRELVFLVREQDPSPSRPSEPADVTPRVIARADGKILTELARMRMPPWTAEVLPVEPRQFFLAPMVAQSLGSESVGWVLEQNGAPTGFFRTTVSHAMAAGHLTAPLLDAGVSDETARSFLRFALRWDFDRGVRRVVCEVPSTEVRSLQLLGQEGFTEAYRLDTLYRPIIG